MTRGDEAVRQVEIGLGTAPFQFVDLAAPVTLEVMMMFLARHFVTWRGAGDLNHANPTVFEQRIDVPVDGGDSESPVALSGTAMDFLGERGRSASVNVWRMASFCFVFRILRVYQGRQNL